MQGNKNTERIKATINWDPNSKTPRVRPKKHWKNKIKDDIYIIFRYSEKIVLTSVSIWGEGSCLDIYILLLVLSPFH